MTLTGNDFALAQQATQLAIAWHRQQSDSDFGATQMAKLDALNKKLGALLDRNDAIVAASDGECEFEVRDCHDMTPQS